MSGGYYKIDMSGRKVELVALNTALYLETNTVWSPQWVMANANY